MSRATCFSRARSTHTRARDSSGRCETEMLKEMGWKENIPMRLAVGRQQGDPELLGGPRVARVAPRRPRARSGRRWRAASRRPPRRSRRRRPDEAVEPDDLAGTDLDGDVVEVALGGERVEDEPWLAGGRGPRRVLVVEVSPTMSSTTLRTDSSPMGHVPTVSPSRMTVTSSQMRKSSSRRCEM